MSKSALQKRQSKEPPGFADRASNGAALIGVGFIAGTFGTTIGGAALVGYGIWRGVRWVKSISNKDK